MKIWLHKKLTVKHTFCEKKVCSPNPQSRFIFTSYVFYGCSKPGPFKEITEILMLHSDYCRNTHWYGCHTRMPNVQSVDI